MNSKGEPLKLFPNVSFLIDLTVSITPHLIKGKASIFFSLLINQVLNTDSESSLNRKMRFFISSSN